MFHIHFGNNAEMQQSRRRIKNKGLQIEKWKQPIYQIWRDFQYFGFKISYLLCL